MWWFVWKLGNSVGWCAYLLMCVCERGFFFAVRPHLYFIYWSVAMISLDIHHSNHHSFDRFVTNFAVAAAAAPASVSLWASSSSSSSNIISGTRRLNIKWNESNTKENYGLSIFWQLINVNQFTSRKTPTCEIFFSSFHFRLFLKSLFFFEVVPRVCVNIWIRHRTAHTASSQINSFKK